MVALPIIANPKTRSNVPARAPKETKMNRALLLIPSLALLLPSLAEAQCPDGASFCAEIEVEGSVSIGGRRQAPPPPPPSDDNIVDVEVEVDAAPPPPPANVQVHPRRRGRVVVVRPAPQAPPPQTVVVAPPPPPQRETTITVTRTTNQVHVRRQQRWNRKFGLTARAAGMLSSQVQMGGLQLGARFRASRVFGVELGFGTYAGVDYNGNDRREHPVTFDFMFFLPKQSRFQAYMLVGGGFSFAAVDTDPDFIDDWDEFDTRYAYIGGQLGLGMEWRLSPLFALSADVRGFLRTRIDEDRDRNPEFEDRATGQTTNTSAGVVGTVGMHFYF